MLAEQFEPRMSVVTLPGAQLCTRRALLQMILSGLHLPYRHMDEGELRLSILEHLRGAPASQPTLREPSPSGRGQVAGDSPWRGEGAPPPQTPSNAAHRPRRLLLLVDEADALPTRLLEELRVLTNVVAHGVPLVSLVLAGCTHPRRAVRRSAARKIQPTHRAPAATSPRSPARKLFSSCVRKSPPSACGRKNGSTPSALEAVYAATGGVPRLVNQLGDQLVWLIEETGCQPLDAALVQQAWSDLQQLPAPWNTDAHSSLSSHTAASVGPFNPMSADGASAPSVIEFGALDDEPAPTARPATPLPIAASAELGFAPKITPSPSATTTPSTSSTPIRPPHCSSYLSLTTTCPPRFRSTPPAPSATPTSATTTRHSTTPIAWSTSSTSTS